MLIVPRHVTPYSDDRSTIHDAQRLPLAALREQAAWVLLGEPGAGKSECFDIEARATGGVLISIAEFVSDEPDPDWRGKTLYLDGLDETRASGSGDSILLQIRSRLRKLERPRFRVACRAADWFGSTDSATLADISPDGRLGVYTLGPLGDDDIQEILSENHHIPDPAAFIGEARQRGIEGLLTNPQTLGLLADAIQSGQWPETRFETYQLACRKLADEESKQHRVATRQQTPSIDALLTTAGQLCAGLLLADKSGIALDRDHANEQFPLLDDFSPDNPQIARFATGRKLFRSPSGSQERVVPVHRCIAEFLAAQWLAERIDQKGLPLGRVLNLFLGLDERTVAGLRGLYGWLALHCQAARPRLIDADPLTVITYGDVKPMSPEDKRRLLSSLQREAQSQIYYRWEIQSASRLGALADPALADDFAATLQSSARDEVSQSMLALIVDVLGEGEPIPSVQALIKAVVLDETYWPAIRQRALTSWLKCSPPASEAISLLDGLDVERGANPDGELLGKLLSHLYPSELQAEKLLGYLRNPKASGNSVGLNALFWGHTFAKVAPSEHLPILLDQFSALTDEAFFHNSEIFIYLDWDGILAVLLRRGLTAYGDQISDERLYAWLGVGANEHGKIKRKDEQQAIADWLAARPDRYKAIVRLCYQHCANAENTWPCLITQKNRLHHATPPADLGLWHLEQASPAIADALAESHLTEAVHALMWNRGCAGLSLEKIEAWATANPTRRHWLNSLLAWDIQPWHRTNAISANRRRREEGERKRARTIALSEHLESIKNGTGLPGVMYELAGVWLDRYVDIHGNTVEERFEHYCDNSHEVQQAAEASFFLCPERHDLPSVAEIIELNIKREQHFIRNPCLVGMALRWQRGPAFIDCLDEALQRRMVAFRLTDGVDHEPEWFLHLVRTSPALVAEVLIAYASASFKAKLEFVDGIYALANNEAYRAVAEAALIPLLTAFPVRIKSTYLDHLGELLKAALRYVPEALKALLSAKLASKGMDVPQRIYWLAVGMLLNPTQYESTLWQYIGNAWVRANHLSHFVSDRFDRLNNDYELSPASLGKLVELLTPHAELESRAGIVTTPMQIGENVRAMVVRLGSLASDEADVELARLQSLPALHKLKDALTNTRHQLRLKQRESAFRFCTLQSVTGVLANGQPTNVADLAALTLDYLDQIAHDIRHDNDDGFRAFWNVEKKKPTSKRDENLCRDWLLRRLRDRLPMTSSAIDCQPEVDYPNDKRADIRISCGCEFALPVEIKRDDHRELWRAAKNQLVTQYASATTASGYGIYLVLWFGKGDMPPPIDGGKKPVSPDELQRRLVGLLDPDERRRIFVRVLDVSWPTNS